jgi:hypothetical protein
MNLSERDIDLVFVGYAGDLKEETLEVLAALSKSRLEVEQPLRLAFVIEGSEEAALPLSVAMHMQPELGRDEALRRARLALNFALPNETVGQRHTRCLKLVSAGAVLVAEEDAGLKANWSEGGCLWFKNKEDLVNAVFEVLGTPGAVEDHAQQAAKVLKAELFKESDKLGGLVRRSDPPQSIFAAGSGAFSPDKEEGLAATLRQAGPKTGSGAYLRFLEGIKAAKHPAPGKKKGDREKPNGDKAHGEKEG